MPAIELTAFNGPILGPIAKVLGWIMNGIYIVFYRLFGVENVVVSILAMTIIIYMCLLPLTIRQQRFSKLSQAMQPEIQAIQAKYKNKKDNASMQAMNEETQMVYQKYGVSPMGSCLQLIIQMPILFGLYRVFYNIPGYITHIKDCFGILHDGTVVSGGLVDIVTKTSGYQDIMTQMVTDYKINSVVTDFTVTDQSTLNNYVVDVLYKLPKAGWESLTSLFPKIGDAVAEITPHINRINYVFGINISETPWHAMTTNFADKAWLMVFLPLLIPLISYATQIVSIRMMPTATQNDEDSMSRQMKSMNMMMPLFSLFICFITPAGLGMYWIFSAVVRIVQQFFINRHFDRLDIDVMIEQNAQKRKKKLEKKGVTEEQMRQAAQIKTRYAGNSASTANTANKNNMASKANTANRSNASGAKTSSSSKGGQSKGTQVSQANEAQAKKADEIKQAARPDSLAAKANLVRDFNERNNKK
ncbi:MAG: YidC/Oxa1 family membrane protein insertase [Clostridiales bacterium]|nr:YidC/Oxa1 family membrane protein insertase [Clostridiales bacterium]